MAHIHASLNKFNIYLNDDDQEENGNKKYIKETNYSSINPIDTSIERNSLK